MTSPASTETALARASRSTGRPVQVAVTLFALGLVFIAVDVIPFFFGSTDHPLWLNLACLCAPAGFVLGVASVWRSGRATQRAALAELSG